MNFFSKLFRPPEIKPTTQSEKTPSNSLIDSHVEEAKRLFQTSDYQQALLHCEQALSQDATNAAVYRLRGLIRYELQDYSGATQDLHRSLELV